MNHEAADVAAESVECRALAEHNELKHNRRRASDTLPASLARILTAIFLTGAGAGGSWMVHDRVGDKVVTAAQATSLETTDIHARQQIELLKAELRGELGLIRQQQEQTNERLRELLRRSR